MNPTQYKNCIKFFVLIWKHTSSQTFDSFSVRKSVSSHITINHTETFNSSKKVFQLEEKFFQRNSDFGMSGLAINKKISLAKYAVFE